MKIYKNEITDPYFNLASEQYLLDTEEDDVFMLWRNRPSVIIGRNQNAYAEINRGFVTDNDIAVVRRLTGGGAVFHDLGNINFTFITKKGGADALDFARFCQPVIDALRALGVPAELSGRNDMTAGCRKFSGNAQCVYNGRVMHHGTLLFDADMNSMAGALNVDPEKMKSKGVKSVRARVCNLREFLPDTDVVSLKTYLENSMGENAAPFSEDQINGINKLKAEKYETWEWNYGKSKEFAKTVKKRFPYGTVEISYTSDHGVLTDVMIRGDYFGVLPTDELERSLCGARLERSDLSEKLADAGKYISGAEPYDLISMFEM